MPVFSLSVSGNPGLPWLIAALFQPHLRGIEHQYTSSPLLRFRQSRPTTELDELIWWMLTTIKSSQSLKHSNSLKHYILTLLSRHPHCLWRGLTTSNDFTLHQAFYLLLSLIKPNEAEQLLLLLEVQTNFRDDWKSGKWRRSRSWLMKAMIPYLLWGRLFLSCLYVRICKFISTFTVGTESIRTAERISRFQNAPRNRILGGIR